MARVLLVGGDGQLGQRLRQDLVAAHLVTSLGREQIDLAKPDQMASTLDQHEYDILLNAAAYTQVDAAQADIIQAMQVNAIAPGVMANHARTRKARFIHCSTDYVFDGKSRRPYREDDPVRPISVYGQSKARGDDAVMAAGGDYWILRFGWVYSLTGRNFLQTMCRLLAGTAAISVVNDQWGTPTWTGTISRTLVHMLAHTRTGLSGLYHLAPTGMTTWCTFAEAICSQVSRKTQIPLRQVHPLTTAQYPTAAARPAYSVLDTSKLSSSFGVKFPSWQDDLDACFAESTAASLALTSANVRAWET